MIKTSVKKNNHQIETITISGHAMHSKHGTDIVCASVSTAIIVTLNAIEHLNYQSNIEFEIRDGYFHVEVIVSHFETYKLLENLLFTLNDLEQQFPKNIKNQKEA